MGVVYDTVFINKFNRMKRAGEISTHWRFIEIMRVASYTIENNQFY